KLQQPFRLITAELGFRSFHRAPHPIRRAILHQEDGGRMENGLSRSIGISAKRSDPGLGRETKAGADRVLAGGVAQRSKPRAGGSEVVMLFSRILDILREQF